MDQRAGKTAAEGWQRPGQDLPAGQGRAQRRNRRFDRLNADGVNVA